MARDNVARWYRSRQRGYTIVSAHTKVQWSQLSNAHNFCRMTSEERQMLTRSAILVTGAAGGASDQDGGAGEHLSFLRGHATEVMRVGEL